MSAGDATLPGAPPAGNTTHPGAPSAGARTSITPPAPVRVGRITLSADAVAGAALTVVLVAIAFVTAGGNELGPNTWAEIVIVLAGMGLAVAVLVAGAPGHRWGAVAFGAFAALSLLTALSVLWSVEPENSWVEAGRTLSYLAAFGGAIALARLLPERWAAMAGAVAAASAVIGAYALLVKVFPATFDPDDMFGRLQAPFEYFNATGLIGALGVPACLWAGARRERARALRAFAAPAIAILVTVIVLSYSRGAVAVAVVGIVLWFAVVPLRLRGALVLALGLIGGAVLSIYALHTHALTNDLVSLQARTNAGQGFGVLLVIVLGALTLAGLAAAFAMDRVQLYAETRRRTAIALLVVVALIPIGGVGALAASSRGPTGEVSHLVSELTSANSGASNNPNRLVQLGNSRGRYWREGITVGEHALLKGTGALGYGTAVTRYTNDENTVTHAHSFVIETFADFGLIGIALAAVLLVSWALAVRRTLGLQWPERLRAPQAKSAAPADPERTGLLTLLTVVVVFGLHSAIDWTWFIPGTAIPALMCAGWLAGRGPAREPIGLRAERRRLLDAPGTGAVVLALVAVALLCAWEAWQPLRSAGDQNAATSALENGHTAAAIGDARSAADVYPVAVEPLWQLAAIYQGRGEDGLARAVLVEATRRQPENPQTWLQLGEFELQVKRPTLALAPLRTAVALDRGSTDAAGALTSAEQAAGTR